MSRTLHVALWVFFSSAATAAPFQPVLVQDRFNVSLSNVHLWGDRLVWRMSIGPPASIYEYRLSTQQTMPLLPHFGNGIDLGGEVYVHVPSVLTTYNIETGESHPLTMQNDTFVYPSIGSKWAAWSASHNGYDVYARRVDDQGGPIGQVVHLDNSAGVQTEVDTDGEFVVWTDRAATPRAIRLANMITGEIATIGTGDNAAIHGSLVAWTNEEGLWKYDLESETVAHIAALSIPSAFPLVWPVNPAIWGDQIVWGDGNMLHGYHVGSGESFSFELPAVHGYSQPRLSVAPSLYQNTIAWIQEQRPILAGGPFYELYVMEIPDYGAPIPEPSTGGLLLLLVVYLVAATKPARMLSSVV